MTISPVDILINKNDYSNFVDKYKTEKTPQVSVLTKNKQFFDTNFSDVPLSVLRQQIIASRLDMLKTIENEKEYNDILKTIFKYVLSSGVFTSNLIMKNGYEHIPTELQGLISYCGAGDLSDTVNSWLTARKSLYCDVLGDEKISNVIRAFEYSLKKLDEKFGSYKGKLYRAGYFNPIRDKQYYSASKSLGCVVKHSQKSSPGPDCPYSIIKVKKGHNIHKFQESVNLNVAKHFAKTEKEILIDRNSRFKRISPKDYSIEDINDILNIINATLGFKMNWDELTNLNRNIDILKWISVWEEI